MGQVMRKMICLPIRLYRYLLSPLIKPSCRFYPSCSEYAISAVEHYGVAKGLYLASHRLLRCHPWSDGGYDPILPKNKEKS